MRCHCAHSSVFAVALLMTVALALPAHAQNRNPDSTLFTIYDAQQPATQIGWLTCGSLPQTEGCYGSGSFGPFTDVCDIVQSVPAPLNLNTVLRYIYILDEGSSAGGATLTVYKRTDMVSQTNDTITTTMVAVVPLPTLVAGPSATCYLVQNPDNVYAATAQGPIVAAINKTNYGVSTFGSGAPDVSALTADSYGFVTIVWGTGAGTMVDVVGPNGDSGLEGGGSYFMINPIDGVNPANFPPFDSAKLPNLAYWPKLVN